MQNTVTEALLNSIIEKVDYHDNGKTTVAILTLKNGFEVVGTSAPVDRANFDQQTGQKYAYENAFNKLWELEGYRLQWKLYEDRN